MKTEDLIKWGAIGLGAYWLYETYVLGNTDVFGSLLSSLTGGASATATSGLPPYSPVPSGAAVQHIATQNLASQQVSNPYSIATQGNPFNTAAGTGAAISGQSTPTVTTDANVISAASSPANASMAGSTMYNWDQWQYYAAKSGGVQVDPSLVGVDRTVPMSAAQYHQILIAAGYESASGTGARGAGVRTAAPVARRGVSGLGYYKSPWVM